MIEQILKDKGIKNPVIEFYDWGIYWFDDDSETNIEGHYKDGEVYLWPWNNVLLISGSPELL